MKILLVVFLAIFLCGCLPATWHVRQEANISGSPELECVRTAIGNVKGVIGVVLSDPNYYYTLTFEKKANPRNYMFETTVGLGYLRIDEASGNPIVEAYFYGQGYDIPEKVTNEGNELLKEIVRAVSTQCT